MNLESIISDNKDTIASIWLKFLNFFIHFIFLALGIGILLEYLMNRKALIPFFTGVNTTSTFNYINGMQFSQNFFINDLTSVIVLIGAIGLYCYFFSYIKTVGLKISSEASEIKGKLSSVFTSAIPIGILITTIILLGGLSGLYGTFPIEKRGEIYFILFMSIIALGNVAIFNILFSKKPWRYVDVESFADILRKENYHKDYPLLSTFIFLITIEVAIYGHIKELSILSIISLEIIFIFIVWAMGVFNSFPKHTSTIRLKTSEETVEGDPDLSKVFVFEINDNYISFLAEDDISREIQIDAVLWNHLNSHCDVPSISNNSNGKSLAINKIVTRNSLNLLGSIFAIYIALLTTIIPKTQDSIISILLWQNIPVLFVINYIYIPVCTFLLAILALLALHCENY